MICNEQGNVYAFRLSGSRMRQSASQLKRQGQALDAIALMRRGRNRMTPPQPGLPWPWSCGTPATGKLPCRCFPGC